MPKRYPAEFRRRALDLITAGRSIAQVALDLEVSSAALYSWRRQELIDAGVVPGLSSEQAAELVAARRRIRGGARLFRTWRLSCQVAWRHEHSHGGVAFVSAHAGAES